MKCYGIWPPWMSLVSEKADAKHACIMSGTRIPELNAVASQN